MHKVSSSDNLTKSKQAGVTLAIVILVTLVLLVLGATVLFSSATNAAITGNYRMANETFAIANTGLERALNWFSREYTLRDYKKTYKYSTFDGITYNNKPVVLRGIPTTPHNFKTVPTSNFPPMAKASGTETITSSFARNLSNQTVKIGGKDYGRFSVDATLVAIRTNETPEKIETVERWQLDIRASEPNASQSAQITAIVELGTPSIFSYAVKADDDNPTGNTAAKTSLTIRGERSRGAVRDSSLINSFDSRNFVPPRTGVSEARGHYSEDTVVNTPASIGSNKDITLSGDVTIEGDVDYLNTCTGCQTARIPRKPNKLTRRIFFNIFNSPEIQQGTSNEDEIPSSNNKGDITFYGNTAYIRGTNKIGDLPPGRYGNIIVKTRATLKMRSGVYIADRVIVRGGGQITIDAQNGPVYIFTGGFEMGKPEQPISTYSEYDEYLDEQLSSRIINKRPGQRNAYENSLEKFPATDLVVVTKRAYLDYALFSGGLYSYAFQGLGPASAPAVDPDGEIFLVDALDTGEVQLYNSEIYGAVSTNVFNMVNSHVHYDVAVYDKFRKGSTFRLVNWSYKVF